jgi:hypothetical protein
MEDSTFRGSTPTGRNEAIIRRVAGTFVLTSLLLAMTVHIGWIGLAAFVGLNLLQSSFTGFCPLEKILEARQKAAATTGAVSN